MAIIGVIAAIVFGTIGFYFYKTISDRDEEYEEFIDHTEVVSSMENTIETEEGKIEEQMIIHVSGCVKQPGIVVLKVGSRVADAIKVAGGPTEEADLNKLNLAYELEDGEKLFVPSKQKEEKEEIEEYVSTESGKYVTNTPGNSPNSNKKVNINQATKEQLQTINGIGESMANKIIQFREANGKFETIEDLKKVPGIGDAKFENMKESITVK